MVENWRKIEEYAVEILAEEGFGDIYYLAGDGFDRMPFDYLARKDGLNFAINVTTYYPASPKKRHKRLAAWCGWVPICLAIKPDFSDYRFVFASTYTTLNTSKDELERLYWQKGMTIAQIAKQMGKSVATILKKMRKYGVSRRRPRDWLIGHKINKGKTPWNKGIPMSEKSKEKLSQALKGRIPWNKGKRETYR